MSRQKRSYRNDIESSQKGEKQRKSRAKVFNLTKTSKSKLKNLLKMLMHDGFRKKCHMSRKKFLLLL